MEDSENVSLIGFSFKMNIPLQKKKYAFGFSLKRSWILEGFEPRILLTVATLNPANVQCLTSVIERTSCSRRPAGSGAASASASSCPASSESGSTPASRRPEAVPAPTTPRRVARWPRPSASDARCRAAATAPMTPGSSCSSGCRGKTGPPATAATNSTLTSTPTPTLTSMPMPTLLLTTDPRSSFPPIPADPRPRRFVSRAISGTEPTKLNYGLRSNVFTIFTYVVFPLN